MKTQNPEYYSKTELDFSFQGFWGFGVNYHLNSSFFFLGENSDFFYLSVRPAVSFITMNIYANPKTCRPLKIKKVVDGPGQGYQDT